MSRYIDADALDRAFSKLRFNNDGELNHYGDRPNWYLWGSEIENLIADAPSIDIVRCNQCKYETICTHSVQHTTHEPTSVTIGYKSVEWCSYGERKDQ